MAYRSPSANQRASFSNEPRRSVSQQQIYEEEPYYANARPVPRQSVDQRRSGSVCQFSHVFPSLVPISEGKTRMRLGTNSIDVQRD